MQMNLLMKTMSIMEERLSLTESRMSQMMALQRTMQQQQQQQQQGQKTDLPAHPSIHHYDSTNTNTSNTHTNNNNYSRNIINSSNINSTRAATPTSHYHPSTSSVRNERDLSPKSMMMTTTIPSPSLLSSRDELLQPVSTPDLRLVQLRVMCRQRGLDPNGSELELLKRLNEATTITMASATTSNQSTAPGYGRATTAAAAVASTGASTGALMEVHTSSHSINKEDYHHHHHDHQQQQQHHQQQHHHQQQQQQQYHHNDDTIEYDLGEDDYNDINADDDHHHRDDDDSHDPLRIIDGEDGDDSSSDDVNVHIIEEDAFELNDEEMFGGGDDYDVEKNDMQDEDDDRDDGNYDI